MIPRNYFQDDSDDSISDNSYDRFREEKKRHSFKWGTDDWRDYAENYGVAMSDYTDREEDIEEDESDDRAKQSQLEDWLLDG